jgi:hypothetical protein
VKNVYHINIRQKYHTKVVNIMAREHAKVCAVTDPNLLDKLTSEAEFSCARCGAKAHDRESVCEPTFIEPDH